MDQSRIEYICKCRSVLSGIPVRIYENNELIFKYEKTPFARDICKSVYPLLFTTEKNISYIVLNDHIIFGLIRVENTPLHILLGPGKSTNIMHSEIKKDLLSLQLDLSELELFENYLESIPSAPVNYFFLMLSELNLYVNNEIVNLYDFVNINSSTLEYNISRTNDNLIRNLEELKYDESPKHTAQAFEEQMSYYIRNGQTDLLKSLFEHSAPGNVGKLAGNQLRQDKNNAIVSIAIATRAAIAGNLNPETAYQLSDIYIQDIEKSTTSAQVLQKNVVAMIDLCDRVKGLQYHHINSPLVDAVVKYISEHISEKITIDDIAKELFISRNHLSTKFKLETGQNLVEYIALQKNTEAKRLITYTKMSLSDISDYLAFSSQSHFQNQFKKLTGMTPMKYRNERTERGPSA